MKPINTSLFACVLLIAVIYVFAVNAEPPKVAKDHKQFPLVRQTQNAPKVMAIKPVAPLMQRKLESAKTMLEGLAMEDFEKISKSARTMKLLSLEAGWNVIQTPEYAQQSSDFRRACDLIENAAKAQDSSRAALSYVALTVRCVECHKYLRDNKIVLTSKRD